VTAATGSSRYHGTSRRELAERWADALRTTLHNVLGPGGQTLRGDPPVEPLRVTMPPWDDRYLAIVKGDRAMERTEYAEAAEWYRKAIIEDRSAYDARYRLGRALARQGRLAEAKEELVASLQLFPDYEPARTELYNVDKELQRRK